MLSATVVVGSLNRACRPTGYRQFDLRDRARVAMARSTGPQATLNFVTVTWLTPSNLATDQAPGCRRARPSVRAEALRRAMLALIDTGSAREAHPATWAPFVVGGEGTAR